MPYVVIDLLDEGELFSNGIDDEEIEKRRNLKPGQHVSLLFDLTDFEGESMREVMWVAITEVKDGKYGGPLLNFPLCQGDLEENDIVWFKPENVVSISREPFPRQTPNLPEGKDEDETLG